MEEKLSHEQSHTSCDSPTHSQVFKSLLKKHISRLSRVRWHYRELSTLQRSQSWDLTASTRKLNQGAGQARQKGTNSLSCCPCCGEGVQRGSLTPCTPRCRAQQAPLGQAAGLHPTCISILPACGLLKCSGVLGLKRGFYPVLAGGWV